MKRQSKELMKYLSDENNLKLGYIDEVTTDIAILESKKLEKIYNKYKNDLSIDKQQQCERGLFIFVEYNEKVILMKCI